MTWAHWALQHTSPVVAIIRPALLPTITPSSRHTARPSGPPPLIHLAIPPILTPLALQFPLPILIRASNLGHHSIPVKPGSIQGRGGNLGYLDVVNVSFQIVIELDPREIRVLGVRIVAVDYLGFVPLVVLVEDGP